MKSNTIKWRIFKYNLVVIIMLIALVAAIFNIAIRIYFERDLIEQLNKIASRTEGTALRRGPDIFQRSDSTPIPRPFNEERENRVFRYYFMLDRSLREPLSVLDADYILLDNNKNIIDPPVEWYTTAGTDLLNKISAEIDKSKDLNKESYLDFHYTGTEYIAVIKPVSQKNNFGLGWIVIYSSLQNINKLQFAINLILLMILLLSAFIIILISSVLSKKISAPFNTLNQHIQSIAERNFGTKITTPVYDEFSAFVNSINLMSEKLEAYDKAQKTFLQNVSHEFRTPLMSIQSYAEGIKYSITESDSAADIIIDESKRLAQLVENLLYLSRLDAIEENYHFYTLDINELLRSCTYRMNGIASKSNITIVLDLIENDVSITADEEKLSRAISNILSNCLRYAKSIVTIKSELIDERTVRIRISDDGPGFESAELPNIFDRFFKGSKGSFGLGLAISRNVIEKHNGIITAENYESGALFQIELPII
ncbi:MAG TPA: HAMP domain-containing sensor histidine kinase [Bacillota bacterium]|nr:HAMP domain-containing sensor histidine kinase [Bacillota bacterium]